MPQPRPPFRDFRSRLKAGAHLAGTFVKTPTSHAVEMLGLLGFDFVVFDGEHAPLDLGALDRMVLGARAANVAGIVRVASAAEGAILSVLDMPAPPGCWCRMWRRARRPRRSWPPAAIAAVSAVSPTPPAPATTAWSALPITSRRRRPRWRWWR